MMRPSESFIRILKVMRKKKISIYLNFPILNQVMKITTFNTNYTDNMVKKMKVKKWQISIMENKLRLKFKELQVEGKEGCTVVKRWKKLTLIKKITMKVQIKTIFLKKIIGKVALEIEKTLKKAVHLLLHQSKTISLNKTKNLLKKMLKKKNVSIQSSSTIKP